MTALEWLISNLQKSKDWQRVLNEVSQMSTVQIELFGKAKQLEREQHGRTWDAAIEAHEQRGHVKARSLADFDEYVIK